jgi:hypothetical protein
VSGGAAPARAAPLGTGLYQDVIHPYGRRWYSIEVPPGRRLVTSVTEIASFKAQGTAEFHVRLLDPHGSVVDLQSEAIQGRSSVIGRTRTFSPRMDEPAGGKLPPGRYRLEAEIAKGGNTIDPLDIPLEIGIQLLKPGEDPGLVRNNGGAPLPAPKPSATPRPTAAPGGQSDPGSGSGTSAAVVLGAGLAGLLAGLAAAAVLGRRRPA